MASSPPVRPRIRIIVSIAKWAVLAMCGLFLFAIMLGVGGVGPRSGGTEITHQQPFANFIDREYRVISDVSAYAWNDFPDKSKILVITLMPPPGVGNRFVSFRTPLKLGQRVRIVSAWRQFVLFEFFRYYKVSVPDAGLPDGIDIQMDVASDGVPDPLVYEPIDR